MLHEDNVPAPTDAEANEPVGTTPCAAWVRGDACPNRVMGIDTARLCDVHAERFGTPRLIEVYAKETEMRLSKEVVMPAATGEKKRKGKR